MDKNPLYQPIEFGGTRMSLSRQFAVTAIAALMTTTTASAVELSDAEVENIVRRSYQYVMLTQFRMNAVCLRRATSPIYCCTSIIGINSYILCTSSIQNTGPSHSVEVWHVGAYVVFYNSLKYVALLYVPGSINTIRHRHTYGTYSYSRTYFMFVRKVLRSISGIVVMPVIP